MRTVFLVRTICFAAGLLVHAVIVALILRNRRRGPSERAFAALVICFGVVLLGHLYAPAQQLLGFPRQAVLAAVMEFLGSAGLCLIPFALVYWLHRSVVRNGMRRITWPLLAASSGVSLGLLAVLVLWWAAPGILIARGIFYDKVWLLFAILVTIPPVSAISWVDGRSVGEADQIRERQRAVTVLTAAFFTGSLLAFRLADSWVLRQHAATALYSTTTLFGAVFAYYQYRFPFMDVVVKRGIFSAATVVLLVLYGAGVVLPLTLRTPRDPSMLKYLVLAVLILPAGWLLPVFRQELYRILDNLMFRRDDRRETGNKLAKAYAESNDAGELVDAVCAILSARLGITCVEWAPESRAGISIDPEPSAPFDKDYELRVPVVAEDTRFGVLVCGRRLLQQPYLSEDLRFIEWAANGLAAALRRLEVRAREQELREMAMRAQMAALRAQINPHFLFNTLNALAGLIRGNPRQAEDVVERLAAIFSYALRSSERTWMTLGEELQFIESYLQIEKTRFEEKLVFSIRCAESLTSCLIPPMILQPLVENAIKHGIGRKLEGGAVRLDVTAAEDLLTIRIADTGQGFSGRPDADGSRGHGLRNVTQRLEKTYAERCHFSISGELGAGATVTIQLPLAYNVGDQAAKIGVERR